MRKRDEVADPKSCLNTAEDDEPLFVLKGRDKFAPALVALWVALRELDGEPRPILAEARQIALDMMGWGSERGRKYVGFGQTTLVGVMEMIRCANVGFKERQLNNEATTEEFLRLVMSRTEFDADGKKTGD